MQAPVQPDAPADDTEGSSDRRWKVADEAILNYQAPTEWRQGDRSRAGSTLRTVLDGASSSPRVINARLVASLLTVVAVLEALVIAGLWARRGDSRVAPAVPVAVTLPLTIQSEGANQVVLVDGRQIGVTPLVLNLDSSMRTLQVVSDVRGESSPSGADTSPPAATSPVQTGVIAAPAPGGLRLNSPIELQVLENGRLIGTSGGGPISLGSGGHQLDLVNEVLGFRVRQAIVIRPGATQTINVQPPDGQVNINADPWAEVLVDGKALGETPLANIAIAAGQHEVIFRHPQFGEHRETIIVKPGVVTRVSAAMKRQSPP